jgi:DNA-binding response OmpR family regulator
VKKTHPATEVIILTGHGSDAEEKLAEEIGAFAYLRKPVDIEVLAETMKAAYRKVQRAGSADLEECCERLRQRPCAQSFGAAR